MLTPSSERIDEFCELIAALFYSVAAADKMVRSSEIKSLHATVNELWVDNTNVTGEFTSIAGHKVQETFDWLANNRINKSKTLSELRNFIEDNSDLFPDHIKILIIKTAERIALAYNRKNKSELVMLARITQLLHIPFVHHVPNPGSGI